MEREAILAFTGQHRFLSNFALVEVMLDGRPYPTVEHAFQASKTLHPAEREEIRCASTAGQAKRMGRRVELRPRWDTLRLDVMLMLLRQKFRQTYFKTRLLDTGEAELIEGNDWGDRFWGVCQGQGENQLGKLIMQVRSELRGKAGG